MKSWKTGVMALSLAFTAAVAGAGNTGGKKDADGASCRRAAKTSDEKPCCGQSCCSGRAMERGLGGEQKNPYVSPGQQSGWWFSDEAPAKCQAGSR